MSQEITQPASKILYGYGIDHKIDNTNDIKKYDLFVFSTLNELNTKIHINENKWIIFSICQVSPIKLTDFMTLKKEYIVKLGDQWISLEDARMLPMSDIQKLEYWQTTIYFENKHLNTEFQQKLCSVLFDTENYMNDLKANIDLKAIITQLLNRQYIMNLQYLFNGDKYFCPICFCRLTIRIDSTITCYGFTDTLEDQLEIQNFSVEPPLIIMRNFLVDYFRKNLVQIQRIIEQWFKDQMNMFVQTEQSIIQKMQFEHITSTNQSIQKLNLYSEPFCNSKNLIMNNGINKNHLKEELEYCNADSYRSTIYRHFNEVLDEKIMTYIDLYSKLNMKFVNLITFYNNFQTEGLKFN